MVVVAGDNWGTIVLPLLTHHPLTSVIILPAYVTVQLGLINVVAASIVDRMAQARSMDDVLSHLESKDLLEKSYKRLKSMFMDMDTDGNGMISIDELVDGYGRGSAFREVMDLMDIHNEDLNLVFQICDPDQSGEIDYEEFVDKLHYIRHVNPHTLLVFTKALAESVCQQQREGLQTIVETTNKHFGNVRKLLSKNSEHLEQRLADVFSKTSSQIVAHVETVADVAGECIVDTRCKDGMNTGSSRPGWYYCGLMPPHVVLPKSADASYPSVRFVGPSSGRTVAESDSPVDSISYEGLQTSETGEFYADPAPMNPVSMPQPTFTNRRSRLIVGQKPTESASNAAEISCFQF